MSLRLRKRIGLWFLLFLSILVLATQGYRYIAEGAVFVMQDFWICLGCLIYTTNETVIKNTIGRFVKRKGESL